MGEDGSSRGLPEPMQAYCLGQEQLLDFAQGHAD